jgi:hypothetical protein
MDKNSTVAIYETHDQAEQAVKQLQKSGFNMKQLSIVGKGYETENHVIGYYNAGDRMKHWGKSGAFWGGIWGLLFGAAFFLIPGIGPVLVAGPLVASIVAGLESAAVVGGLGAIGGALFSLGIPKNSIILYESSLKADKFLLVAHGTASEVAKAQEILKTTDPVEINVHSSQHVEAPAPA